MTPKLMTAEERAEQLVSKHGPFQKLSEGNSEYAIEEAIKEHSAALDERVKGLEKVLTKKAEHHEDQANAWGGEEGDVDNAKYHRKLAKECRSALAGGQR